MRAVINCLAASTLGLPAKTDQDQVPTEGKFPAGPAGNGAWAVSASRSGSLAVKDAKSDGGLKTKATCPALYALLLPESSHAAESSGINPVSHQPLSRPSAAMVPGLSMA